MTDNVCSTSAFTYKLHTKPKTMKYRVNTHAFTFLDKGEIFNHDDRVEYDGQQVTIQELAEVFSQWFTPVEEDFKKGDWVILTGSYSRIEKGSIFRINKFQCGDKDFPVIEEFGEEDPYRAPHKRNLRKATKDEIEAVLIPEAKRRGFKAGARVKRDWNFVNELNYDAGKIKSKLITNGVFDYDAKRDVLFMGKDLEKTAIYWEGKFASVIDEPITINGCEVSIAENSNYFKVGCQNIFKDNFMAFSGLVIQHGLEVFYAGEDITKQIKQIAERL